jgi:hypothetical protein
LLIYGEADLLQLPTRKILRTSGQDGSRGEKERTNKRLESLHPDQRQFHAYCKAAHHYPAVHPAAQLLGEAGATGPAGAKGETGSPAPAATNFRAFDPTSPLPSTAVMSTAILAATISGRDLGSRDSIWLWGNQ